MSKKPKKEKEDAGYSPPNPPRPPRRPPAKPPKKKWMTIVLVCTFACSSASFSAFLRLLRWICFSLCVPPQTLAGKPPRLSGEMVFPFPARLLSYLPTMVFLICVYSCAFVVPSLLSAKTRIFAPHIWRDLWTGKTAEKIGSDPILYVCIANGYIKNQK